MIDSKETTSKQTMALRPSTILLLVLLLPLVYTDAFLQSSPTKAYNLRYQLRNSSIHQSSSTTSSPRRPTHLFAENKKASVKLSSPQIPTTLSPTTLVDYILSLVTSDLSSIVLGSIGILLALTNRLTSIDLEATNIASNQAIDMGTQSRMDLLAVFSAGAVLLNGVSKLDITSVTAETVELEGTILDRVEYVNFDDGIELNRNLIDWALDSVLQSSPARSAVLLVCLNENEKKWNISALKGVVPFDSTLRQAVPDGVSTPILDRFLKEGQGKKETYLPTLQALPGRTEITYLPGNTQEVLMLPIDMEDSRYCKGALVLGSDTAKSFTPRDVAWCQVIATRLGDLCNAS
jgi:Protein of unknown function (DUF2930).